MSDFLNVHEAATTIGVSPDTIRRWEKKGLIKAQRSELNHRLFDIREIERIHGKVTGESSGNNYKILKSSKKSPYSVIELFAGAGGTALGFHNGETPRYKCRTRHFPKRIPTQPISLRVASPTRLSKELIRQMHEITPLQRPSYGTTNQIMLPPTNCTPSSKDGINVD